MGFEGGVLKIYRRVIMMIKRLYPAGTQPGNDVVSTSMRRHGVASKLIQRRFGVMRLLDYRIPCYVKLDCRRCLSTLILRWLSSESYTQPLQLETDRRWFYRPWWRHILSSVGRKLLYHRTFLKIYVIMKIRQFCFYGNGGHLFQDNCHCSAEILLFAINSPRLILSE